MSLDTLVTPTGSIEDDTVINDIQRKSCEKGNGDNVYAIHVKEPKGVVLVRRGKIG